MAGDFALALRQLRDAAGRPSFRRMASRAHCSAATLCRAVAGDRLPGLEVTLAFAAACDGDRAEWARRWRAAAAAESAARPRLAALAGSQPAAARPGAAPGHRGPGVPRQLPYPTAGFAGRHREMAALHDLLGAAAAGGGMAAISGMAGAGKTALAVRFGHQVADRFPDGQLFLDLRGFGLEPARPPGEALGRILRSLGADVPQIPPGTEDRALMYRSVMAQRRMIVLLDNAASAEHVSLLVPGAPQCLILVTSRCGLAGLAARYGARQITLGDLSPGESLQLLGALIGPVRIAAEQDAAQRLTRLCGHLPLALRLAAGALTVQPGRPIADLVAELASDRLGGLEIDEGPAVSAAFDLSYQRLDGPAARTFRLLGLLPGPHFSVASAAAITGEPGERADGQLAGLVALNLVETCPPGRYRFHDLVRVFAGRLSRATDPVPDRNRALGQLLSHYYRHADAASRLLYPTSVRLGGQAAGEPVSFDAGQAGRWLEDERPNCVALIRACAGQRPHAPGVCALADALSAFLQVRSYSEDRLTVGRAGLAAALLTGDVQAETAMRRILADSLFGSGRYPEAEAEYDRARDASRACGWRAAEAAILSSLAVVAAERCSPPQALANYRRSLLIYEELGDRAGAVGTMSRLGGDLLWKLGRLEMASSYLTKALAASRAGGLRTAELAALVNLGNVTHEMGDLETALGYFTAALTISQEVGSAIGTAIVLCDLGGVHRDLGHFDQSIGFGTRALASAREIGDFRVEAECLNALADYHLRTASPAAAADCAREALRLASGHGHRYTRARALNRLAAAMLDSGDPAAAASYCTAALELASPAGYRMLEGIALTVAARIARARGDDVRAAQLAHQAVTILRKTGHRPGEAAARALLDQARRP